MYAVIQDGKAVAFHDEHRVVKIYCKSLLKSNPSIQTEIRKIPDKKVTKVKDYYDYYLVRIGDTYVQSKYYTIATENHEQLMYDLNYSRDILYRLLEFSDTLSKKEIRALEKSISIIDFQIKEEKEKILDIKSLETMDSNKKLWEYQTMDVFNAEDKPWIL